MATAFNILMRIVCSMISLLMMAFGVILVAQVTGAIPGSFMIGSLKWGYFGGGLAAVGLLQLIWANIRQALE